MTNSKNFKNFALIGAAGYVAPRHMRAIKDTGHNLLAAYDPFDSVGIMDSYFPDADFFTEFERFDRHIEKLKRSGIKLDFLSVCSPNYLHDAHIRFGLRHGADVICEKPIVLNPWNIKALEAIEKETDKNIYTILQLRLHPAIAALKEKIDADPDTIHDVNLTYMTSRGKWYYTSWKGELIKSGGIATNIGVHFFDMLQWIFGPVEKNKVHIHTHDRAAGFLQLKKARVKWFMSINYDLIPEEIKKRGDRTFRSILVDEEEIEFSTGFTDLHTKSYEAIFNGDGFNICDSGKSIEIVHEIRNAVPLGLENDYHPLAAKPITSHPFALE